MGFGKKFASPVTSYAETNGGSGKDVFFPTASGEKGTTVTHTFRMFPDVDGREETEVLAQEWRGKVKVNGRETWRSMLVRKDNPNDTALWELINEVKASDATDEDKQEAIKPLRQQLAKRVFFINVFNSDLGQVQVFKGTWEEHVLDEVSGNLKPKSAAGGKSIYAKMLAKIQLGARVQDPKNKLKAIAVKDPAKFEMLFTISGEGMRKSYDFSIGAVSDIDPDILALPRYDLQTWVSDGVGIWPNEAVEKVIAGQDFYTVASEYNVKLYPELEVLEAVLEPVSATEGDDSDGDALFD